MSSTSTPPAPTYTYIYETDTTASAEAIWALYEDVDRWPDWDAGAEKVTRNGAFAAGSTGTMKLVGQDEALHYRLATVKPLTEFVDETPVGPMTVRVAHRLTPIEGGGVRVSHRVEIAGPPEQTAQVGPAITSDMPDTIAALIRLASRRP